MAGAKASGNTSKTWDTQTGTTTTTPQTPWATEAYKASQGAGAAGPSPLVTGAAAYNTGQMQAGNLGMGALSGDPNAVATLMNPYQRQVIDATNAQFDRSGLLAVQGANQSATSQGAFGGARGEIQAGTAQAQNEMNRNSTVGGLLYGGYGAAMNQANTLAQYGQSGANANANLGMGGVGSPDQWMAQMLKQYNQGNPYATTTSGTQGRTNTNVQGGFQGWVL